MLDILILGSACAWLVIYASLLRNAWWEAYPAYDRDADTWDGKVDGNGDSSSVLPDGIATD